MKIIAENWIDLGDAGQHQVTAVGFCQCNGDQVHCLVNSVTVEPKGFQEIDIWPLLRLNGMSADVEQWLLDAFDCRCKSVAETIREQEYRDHMQQRMECES